LRISLFTAFTAHYFTAHCIHCALVSGLQRGEADGQSFARARQRPAVSVEKCARPAVASPPDLYSIPVPGRKASPPPIAHRLFVDALTRSGVSGRVVGRNRFIGPAALQDPRRLRGYSEGAQ